MPHDHHQTIEHLFRQEYGKVVALLTHKFGTSHLEQIEDATQDTFIKAMQVWAYKSVPDNPTAWLYRVASNRLIDVLRRDKKMNLQDTERLPQLSGTEQNGDPTLDATLSDSQLKMIFACCHPTLSQEHQIVLSLKLIGGFSNKELAEALLKKEEAVAKSFTRAKKKFREEVKMLKIPVEMGLQSRLFRVLQVIYLLFSEGYAATSGTLIIKRDICYEALRLALLMQQNTYCQHPNLEALIALMCFHASRFDARLDDKGELVTLEYQDRSKYNQELITIGIRHLENAGTKDGTPSKYHLEAARSYYHSTSKTFGETDWKNILYLYDLQLKLEPSPMVALHRIIAFTKIHGAEKAFGELEQLEQKSDFANQALFHAIKAELWSDLGKPDQQKAALEKAISLTENELVKNHYWKKMEA
ncbi:sigma-70 family RNA polymerase sigma factor [Flagellimonas alvinocaridis]|uniref:Sigma-70 family RNA polymerase sigma factor n=1 Tax=Flagellimonas alvinocaridis TaxID=2530200 RepID=A0A4S8RV35_9FLAO|nr:sigma-70 family RNA polymerase sigma factor [Allomuricauda alvinocaridis]THV61105.1 sigma-70 family RNA polymerase sigma factor [Allomuricauda alvinocaridis]